MKPLLLHYYLTNRCNAKCSFCSIWQEPSKQDAMAANVLTNLLAARKLGCKFVDFTGGEPLLHPDLPLFLKEAKKLGFITSVTTNCLLFEKRCNEIAGFVDLLHFSLDGDTAEIHDTIRGVKSFDAVMRSIDMAISKKLSPDLLFTYNDSNVSSISGVAKLAFEKKLILILDPEFSTQGEQDPVSSETHLLAKKAARKLGVYLNGAHIALRKNGGNKPNKPICKAVSTTIVVLPSNKIALPCYHHSTEYLEGGVGNIAFGAHKNIWKVAQGNEGKYPFCEGCHINCYFDPSFHKSFNRLALLSLSAKLKYAFDKYVVYRHSFENFFK